MAAGNDQGSLIIWKVTKTRPRLTLNNHSSNVATIKIDQSAQNLFAGTNGGSVYVWDLNNQESRILQGHRTAITSIAYEDETHLLATASGDATVKIWDLREKAN